MYKLFYVFSKNIDDYDDQLLCSYEPSRPSPVIFPKEKVCVTKVKF